MIWVATSPEALPGEIPHINALFYAGLDVLLLRKPGFTTLQYERLLKGIDPLFFSRIMIAGQPELVVKYGLRGLHMSEAFRAAASLEDYAANGWQLSTSIHAEKGQTWTFYPAAQHAVFVEIRNADPVTGQDDPLHVRSGEPRLITHALPSAEMWNHLILGPVFNSISKPGHMGRLAEMKNIPANALAIGGITEKNIGSLRSLGFSGVVLLGAIWNDPFNAVLTYQSIKAAWNRT